MMLSRAVVAATIILVSATSALGATKTSVIRFSPWSAQGLRYGFTVSQKASGSCWIHSLVSDRGDAWRCFEGNDILDPCFANGELSLAVACAESPFSDRVVLLKLKKPLKDGDNATARLLQPKGEPWGLRLTSGDRCVFVAGATDAVGGERLNYACGKAGWIIGDVDRSTATWRARAVKWPDSHVTLVSVTSAVF